MADIDDSLTSRQTSSRRNAGFEISVTQLCRATAPVPLVRIMGPSKDANQGDGLLRFQTTGDKT